LTLPRRFSLLLLGAALLLPSSAALAQDTLVSGDWVGSDDGHLFARSSNPNATPGVVSLETGQFPASLDGQTMPDMLHTITSESPGAPGFDIVKILSEADVPDPGAGRRPVAGLFVADDTGATWATDQRNVFLSPPCDGVALDDCLELDVYDQVQQSLFNGEMPPPYTLDPNAGEFLTQGHLDDPGAVVAMAGGATVKTTVKAKPGDESITIRADADILPGFGGRFRGFGAGVIDVEDLLGDDPARRAAFLQTFGELVTTKVKKNGTAKRVLECPASGRGLVGTQYRFDRLGRGAGEAFGMDGLTGGATVVVVELHPVRCGRAPSTGPFAAVGCVNFDINHTALGRDPSFILVNGVFYTVSITEIGPLMVDVTVGGMNGGRPLMLDLQPIDVGLELNGNSPGPEGSMVNTWYFEGAGGINSLGDKKIKSFVVDGDGFGPIELKSDVRNIIGKAIKVDADETVFGNCPALAPLAGEDFADTAASIFADGFEGADTGAWSETGP
jgi:hypothetical protein